MTGLEYVFIVFPKKNHRFLMFIVYTSANGVIQGIASITESPFFHRESKYVFIGFLHL